MLRNVLIFHAGALGDFVQTWPLGVALGRLYPQSRIMYVTHRQKGELAEKLLRLESLDIESGWHHLFGDIARLPDDCRSRLESAHSVFTFITKPGDAWVQAVATISPSAKIVAMSHRLLDSLCSYPAIHAAVSQILASIAGKGISHPMQTDGAPIAVHPGSGSPAKCWPLDSYLRLIELLQAAGHPCRIILGEVEHERWPAEQICRLQSAAQTVHPATYVDLFQELSRCCAFIGNDSGPGQLAGILGLPSVILFGPTDPAIWKPLGPRVTALRAQPLLGISPERIVQTILRESPPTLCSAQAD
ncbi:MAG TPA: glycosyltransferase family 9 protein [Tepidisphaeraceae bacterium]|jgi:ADP-heptose:LPS heptosyltransferase|nr:glycosyltransferase family 9 protein [Tepidisphaeraceae bacterium]